MSRTGWWDGLGAAVRRRRGVSGLLIGLVIGVVSTLLISDYALPRLRGGQRWEPGRLVILSGTDDGSGGQRQALIDQWNALDDGRPKAEIIPVTGGATAAHAAMLDQAQAESSDVDIYNLDVTLMAEFVEFDYIEPLDAGRVDLDGFLPGPLDTCRRGGKLWALPFNTDAGLLYYRSDLISAGQVPESWTALRNTAESIFRRPPDQRAGLDAGYAGQLADYEGLTVNALEAIWAAGGRVLDDDGTVVVDTPAVREGLRHLAEGLTASNPHVILPESRDFDETATTQAFRDGRVAFMRNWPVAYLSLATGGEPGQPTVKFGVAPLPGHSVLGGQNLAVAAHTDQPRAAQELIKFLTSERSQQLLFERGGFAATRELVYLDPRVREQHPYSTTLLAAIKRADRRPETPYYAGFSEVFRDGVRHALDNGGQWPEGFTDRLANALKGIGPD